MKKIFLLLSLILVLGPWSVLFAASSLSDLAIEEFEKDSSAASGRNPFAPSELTGEAEMENLLLEGFLIGEEVSLGLISGQIVQPEMRVGPFTVAEILPGEIVLTRAGEEFHLKMEGFLEPLSARRTMGYQVEFRNADIRDALRLIATAAGKNLITPEGTSGRVNLSFNNISLENAMRSILKVNNYSFALENEVIRVGKPDDFQGGTDLLATTFELKYAKAKSLEDQVKLLLSDKGSVSAVERNNILSVKDYDANVENVRRFIAEVDRLDQQVQIEAHIVDATNDFSRALGVQWGANSTAGRVRIGGGNSTGTITVGSADPAPTHVQMPAANPTSAAVFRIGQLPGGTNLDLQLTAAEERGDIRILSKPQVTTINNTPASIKSGVTIYVKSNSDITIGTSGGAAGAGTSNLQAIETGIQLDVTPQITPNDYIKLTIEANESEADFSRTVDGIPAILDNTATTTVILRNGETAVIGGLIKKRESTTRRSVPGISKVPVIGLFFKSKSKTNRHTELMVFITPRILD